MSSSSQLWLVTGASSGFGLEIVLAALQSNHGHRVIGTVRSRTRAAEAVRKIEDAGGIVVELDVAKDPKSVRETMKTIEATHGPVDVLVNNAGYAIIGALEDISEQETRDQIQTNVFGPITLIRAVLPSMRSKRAGTIVNISSIAGLDGLPACAMYAASKFALEGMSESLARELAPFNIRVLVVEPGAFKTNFQGALIQPAEGWSADYKGGPAELCLHKLEEMIGKQPGDPVKGANVIVDVVSRKDGPQKDVLRVPLGPDCVGRIEQKAKTLLQDLEAGRTAAMSTNF